ncbi:hypothetical protein BCR44DRAFT_1457206 [Catenaria anguillulae PL171]|uniref:Uncharacterized protein n=1 Tax=Catenaria anguillulae PL171 TaxID=765915 RepID=A0A1Y2I4D2_9FUNG|nr:hypothetical protein BCR44DRAFT_1457206 [Catenaria anguillulae PL171]
MPGSDFSSGSTIKFVNPLAVESPLVVLNGQLYLASLLENERNRQAPDMSGLKSLWGSAVDERVVHGLVMVPYPLQLVTELTIDALASAQGRDVSGLKASLPFVDDFLGKRTILR